MSWGFDATEWQIRVPVTITTGVAAATDLRVTVLFDPDFALFWDNVDSNGYFIEFADADGNALDWDRLNWVPATRNASLRIDYTTPAGSTTGDLNVIYMYLTKSGAGPTGGGDQSSTLSGTPTAANGYPPPATLFPTQGFKEITGAMVRNDDGTYRPKDELVLLQDGTFVVLLIFGDVFMKNTPGSEYNGKPESEVLHFFSWDVIDNAGSTQAGWFTETDARVVAGGAGDSTALALYLPVTPDSATSYRLKVEPTTNKDRILSRWAKLLSVEPSIA